MQTILILGDGGLGTAVADARPPAGRRRPRRRPAGRRAARSVDPDRRRRRRRGISTRRRRDQPLERPRRGRHAASSSRPRAGRPTVSWSPVCCRRMAPTAVAASNFSLGVALFGRLIDSAVALFGRLDAFDPYLVEWHRRAKLDRPSGTARDLAGRIVDGHPGLSETGRPRGRVDPGGVLARDAPRRLRRPRRDRRAAADRPRPLRLCGRDPRLGRLADPRRLAQAGIHAFDPIVDELLARDPIAA